MMSICSFIVVVGEIANFAAYTFAPAILVTPLGALSIIFRYGSFWHCTQIKPKFFTILVHFEMETYTCAQTQNYTFSLKRTYMFMHCIVALACLCVSTLMRVCVCLIWLLHQCRHANNFRKMFIMQCGACSFYIGRKITSLWRAWLCSMRGGFYKHRFTCSTGEDYRFCKASLVPCYGARYLTFLVLSLLTSGFF